MVSTGTAHSTRQRGYSHEMATAVRSVPPGMQPGTKESRVDIDSQHPVWNGNVPNWGRLRIFGNSVLDRRTVDHWRHHRPRDHQIIWLQSHRDRNRTGTSELCHPAVCPRHIHSNAGWHGNHFTCLCVHRCSQCTQIEVTGKVFTAMGTHAFTEVTLVMSTVWFVLLVGLASFIGGAVCRPYFCRWLPGGGCNKG